MRVAHVGFRTEGFAPFAYLFQQIGRDKYDLDLQPAALFNREGAERDLVGGEVSFLLGQHFTPVAATARGTYSLCWLTVPQVEHEFAIVTRPEIDAVEELAGKSMLLGEARCPALNAMLMLRKLGLEDKVIYLNAAAGSGPVRDDSGRSLHTHQYFLTEVKEGRADCVIGYPPLDIHARRMNLKVLDAPRLDVISGPLITTTPGFAYNDPEMTKDILRAYLEAIHTFKTDKEQVLHILLHDRERLLRMGFEVDDQEILDDWFERRSNSLQEKPYPTPASLEWTEYKAGIDCPEALAGGVNAVRTMDLHFLQTLDREGFIDSLWSRK